MNILGNTYWTSQHTWKNCNTILAFLIRNIFCLIFNDQTFLCRNFTHLLSPEYGNCYTFNSADYANHPFLTRQHGRTYGMHCLNMMTLWNGNIFHVTGTLWGESTDHRWNPITKASDAELWCCLWTVELLVIWEAMMFMWRYCNEPWVHNEISGQSHLTTLSNFYVLKYSMMLENCISVSQNALKRVH